MGKLFAHLRNQWMGALALFLVLAGGTAYAATELEKNEVKSKHVKNGGVKTKDLADNAVTSPKVADGSLLGADFAAGQLPQGPQGEAGSEGPAGPRGPQGIQGPAGATNATIRRNDGVTVPANDYRITAAPCLPGERAVGGGYDITGGEGRNLRVFTSIPAPTNGPPPDRWHVEAANVGANPLSFQTYVVCVSP